MHETRVHVKRHPLRGNHCHKDARFIMEVRGKKSGGTVYLYMSAIFRLLNTLHKSRSYLESMESSLRQNFLGFKITIQLPRTILVCYRVQNIIRTRICTEKKKKKREKRQQRLSMEKEWKSRENDETWTKFGKIQQFSVARKSKRNSSFLPCSERNAYTRYEHFSENGNNYRALVIVFSMNRVFLRRFFSYKIHCRGRRITRIVPRSKQNTTRFRFSFNAQNTSLKLSRSNKLDAVSKRNLLAAILIYNNFRYTFCAKSNLTSYDFREAKESRH